MSKQEDLLKRLKNFSINTVKLIRDIPKTEENRIYGKQVIRSSSSIGANYSEALCAHTKPDFAHDLNKCRKESNESAYWFELLLEINPTYKDMVLPLLNESKEYVLIFTSSVKTTISNMKSGEKFNHK